MTPSSEIGPNDSASVVADDDEVSELAVGGRSRPGNKRKGTSASKIGGGSAVERSSEAAAAIAHDDGTYLFKFLSPGGTTHRFVARSSDFVNLREIIAGKLATDPFFTSATLAASTSTSSNSGALDPGDFNIHYTDDDADLVLLSSGGDLEDAVRTARKQGKDRVLLIIKGGKGWENAVQNQAAHYQQQAQAHNAALRAVKEEDDNDEQEVEKNMTNKGKKVKADASAGDEELVLGFLKKDMVLPAAIAFLGVAVIGVFALSRGSKH